MNRLQICSDSLWICTPEFIKFENINYGGINFKERTRRDPSLSRELHEPQRPVGGGASGREQCPEGVEPHLYDEQPEIHGQEKAERADPPVCHTLLFEAR